MGSGDGDHMAGQTGAGQGAAAYGGDIGAGGGGQASGREMPCPRLGTSANVGQRPCHHAPNGNFPLCFSFKIMLQRSR